MGSRPRLGNRGSSEVLLCGPMSGEQTPASPAASVVTRVLQLPGRLQHAKGNRHALFGAPDLRLDLAFSPKSHRVAIGWSAFVPSLGAMVS